MQKRRVGILESIESRFARKPPAETPAEPAETSLGRHPPPPQRAAALQALNLPSESAQSDFLVARVPELEDRLVVVVFERSAGEMVKKTYAGHALWLADELIYFVEQHATFEGEKNAVAMIENHPGTVEDLKALFVAACWAKITMGAYVSREKYQYDELTREECRRQGERRAQ